MNFSGSDFREGQRCDKCGTRKFGFYSINQFHKSIDNSYGLCTACLDEILEREDEEWAKNNG